jgi:hypothetical protein
MVRGKGKVKCSTKSKMQAKVNENYKKLSKSRDSISLESGNLTNDQKNVAESCSRSKLGDPNISDEEYKIRFKTCYTYIAVLENTKSRFEELWKEEGINEEAYNDALKDFNHCKKHKGWK